MSRFDDRLERDLQRIAQQATPSSTALASIHARIGAQTDQPVVEVIMLEPDPSPPRRRWALVAAAVAVVVLVGGLIYLVADPGDSSPADDPAPPTTTPADPSVIEPPSEAALAELTAAMDLGELDDVLAVLSPESNCALPGGGSERETCEQQFGFLLAIGGFLEPSCERPDLCRLTFGSELHAVMGYPDGRLPIPFELDGQGRVAVRFDKAPVERPFVGTGDDTGRLWVRLGQMRPDLDVSANFGPALYDREAGEALMAAATALNDPASVAAALQTAFDEQYLYNPGRCVTQDGSRNCTSLFEFLYAIDADIQLACQSATGDTVPCSVTMTSDLHAALGSEPTITPAEIVIRGGVVTSLTLEVRFAADPDVNDAFLAHAATVDGLFEQLGSGTRPLLTAESAPAWLAAAQDYAADE
jgi:hypothetical protein